MPSLYFNGPRELEWRDEDPPVISSDQDAIVRTVAVATCDLDSLIVNGHSPFPGPFVLGHEGVAIVTEVGDAVTNVRPGDRVLVPFQINCGTCGACSTGRTGNCESLPLAQTYRCRPWSNSRATAQRHVERASDRSELWIPG